MRHLPTKPCEKCGEPTNMRIRRFSRFWWGKWHWFCLACSPAMLQGLSKIEIPEHVLQEYSAQGNLCHFPGCDKTIDEHPKEIKK